MITDEDGAQTRFALKDLRALALTHQAQAFDVRMGVHAIMAEPASSAKPAQLFVNSLTYRLLRSQSEEKRVQQEQAPSEGKIAANAIELTGVGFWLFLGE